MTCFFRLLSLDIFEAFTYLVQAHELHDHPGIKLIMKIGEMIVDAACDEKLDGAYLQIKLNSKCGFR